MKSVLKTVVCSVVILVQTYYNSNAQLNIPKYQFGIGVGTYVYQGDLTPTDLGSYKTLKPALYLFASKLMSPSFALRLTLGLGKLKGDDSKYDSPEYRQQRNFKFTSPVKELSAMAEWNIFGRNYASRGFSPYLFAGVSYTYLKIQRDYSNLNVDYFGEDSELMAGLAADAKHSLPKGLLV